MDTAKQSAVQMRAGKLKTLRVQAGQTSAWQVSILEVVEELARENLLFRREIISLKTEVAQLKNESLNA